MSSMHFVLESLRIGKAAGERKEFDRTRTCPCHEMEFTTKHEYQHHLAMYATKIKSFQAVESRVEWLEGLDGSCPPAATVSPVRRRLGESSNISRSPSKSTGTLLLPKLKGASPKGSSSSSSASAGRGARLLASGRQQQKRKSETRSGAAAAAAAAMSSPSSPSLSSSRFGASAPFSVAPMESFASQPGGGSGGALASAIDADITAANLASQRMKAQIAEVFSRILKSSASAAPSSPVGSTRAAPSAAALAAAEPTTATFHNIFRYLVSVVKTASQFEHLKAVAQDLKSEVLLFSGNDSSLTLSEFTNFLEQSRVAYLFFQNGNLTGQNASPDAVSAANQRCSSGGGGSSSTRGRSNNNDNINNFTAGASPDGPSSSPRLNRILNPLVEADRTELERLPDMIIDKMPDAEIRSEFFGAVIDSGARGNDGAGRIPCADPEDILRREDAREKIGRVLRLTQK